MLCIIHRATLRVPSSLIEQRFRRSTFPQSDEARLLEGASRVSLQRRSLFRASHQVSIVLLRHAPYPRPVAQITSANTPNLTQIQNQPNVTQTSRTSIVVMNLIDLLHQKLELFRLEQRYTRRRNRRSTFVSEAQYVDGEYIYSPTSSYSAKCSAGSSDSDEAADRGSKEAKSSRRMSKMGLDKMDWRKGRQENRQSRVSVREVKWDGGVRV